MIEPSDITRWAPSLSAEDVIDITEEANAAIRVHAPCVLAGSADILTLARGIIRRAVQSDSSIPVGVDSETIGPFTARFRARGKVLLSASDIAELRGLCDAPPTNSGGVLPRGSFPVPVSLDGLFESRA